MRGRFSPLARCPGLKLDTKPCRSWIDAELQGVCSACLSRSSKRNPPRAPTRDRQRQSDRHRQIKRAGRRAA